MRTNNIGRDDATHTRYVRTKNCKIPTQKKHDIRTYVYTAVYMLAGDGAVFETYQKRTTLISEWGRVARYHSRVGHRRCWTAAASKGLLSLVCVVVVLVAMRFASYTLAFDGHVGRSRVLNPAPLYFFYTYHQSN